VDQVVVTLSACVATMSDLDVFVETLESDISMGLMDRLRWTTKAQSLVEVIAKLQMHKSSILMMLTILTWCVTHTSTFVDPAGISERVIWQLQSLNLFTFTS